MNDSSFPESFVVASVPAEGTLARVTINAIRRGNVVIEQVEWKMVNFHLGEVNVVILINRGNYDFAVTPRPTAVEFPTIDQGTIEGPIVGRFNRACEIEFGATLAEIFQILKVKATAI